MCDSHHTVLAINSSVIITQRRPSYLCSLVLLHIVYIVLSLHKTVLLDNQCTVVVSRLMKCLLHCSLAAVDDPTSVVARTT